MNLTSKLEYSGQNILVSINSLQNRVSELARQISTDYTGKTLDVVCILNSATFFCIDLVKQITIPTRLHFVSFTNFAEGNASGEIRILLDITEPLYDRHVLVIEGIIVSGRTPQYLVNILSQRNPASLAICALGAKSEGLKSLLPLNYIGFKLGKEVAVGYGIGSTSERPVPFLFEKRSDTNNSKR